MLTLPQSGAQDYSTLTDYVKEKLPTKDFVLVAESFSGPIAAQLAQQNLKNLKGIIFVATFLSSPNKTLLRLSKRLPIKLLSKLPTARYIIQNYFFGGQANRVLINQFINTIYQVPTTTLKQSMQSLKLDEYRCSIPTLYIQPKFDRLMSNTKAQEFQKKFENIVIEEVDGPHFILQTQPKQCTKVITKFTTYILLSSSD